jgi:hypothetical protein
VGCPVPGKRGHNFDILSFAGTTDRFGVFYYPILDAELARAAPPRCLGRHHWHCRTRSDRKRAILERYLAKFS